MSDDDLKQAFNELKASVIRELDGFDRRLTTLEAAFHVLVDGFTALSESARQFQSEQRQVNTQVLSALARLEGNI